MNDAFYWVHRRFTFNVCQLPFIWVQCSKLSLVWYKLPSALPLAITLLHREFSTRLWLVCARAWDFHSLIYLWAWVWCSTFICYTIILMFQSVFDLLQPAIGVPVWYLFVIAWVPFSNIQFICSRMSSIFFLSAIYLLQPGFSDVLPSDFNILIFQSGVTDALYFF